jgi:hypothetical protein
LGRSRRNEDGWLDRVQSDERYRQAAEAEGYKCKPGTRTFIIVDCDADGKFWFYCGKSDDEWIDPAKAEAFTLTHQKQLSKLLMDKPVVLCVLWVDGESEAIVTITPIEPGTEYDDDVVMLPIPQAAQ